MGALLVIEIGSTTRLSRRPVSRPSSDCEKSVRSADAGAREALDEIALEGQEDDHHRHHVHQGERHGAAVVGAELALQIEQPDRQGEQLVLLQGDQRPGEVVPGLQQAHEEQHGDQRLGQRQHDPAEGRPVPGAVEPGRLDQVARDGQDELPGQEDPERRRRGGQDDRPVAAVQTEPGDQPEQRRP